MMDYKEFLESYPEGILRRLSEAPHGSAPCLVYLEIVDTIRQAKKSKVALADLLEAFAALPLESKITHNGSFHAWDVELICRTTGKVYNLFQGGEGITSKNNYMIPPEVEGGPYESSYSTFSICYIPDKIYDALVGSSFISDLLRDGDIFIYNSLERPNREADPSESLKDLVKRDGSKKVADMLLTKSAKLWKKSREYDPLEESATSLPLIAEEEDDEEGEWNQMSKIMILYGKNPQP